MLDDESRARYRDGVTRLLSPGERVRAVAQVRVGMGLSPAEPPQPAAPAPSGGPGILGFLLNLLSPNLTFGPADRFVDWLFFGVGGRGEAGSEASLLHHALETGTSGSGVRYAVLAVTDQRLLLGATAPVGLLSGAEEDKRAQTDIELLRSVPHAAVAGARVGWYRLNWKRLRIDFIDGSWLSFHVPMAESGKPLREVAAALSAD